MLRKTIKNNEVQLRWSPPNTEWIKCNCDAAWFCENNGAGLGVMYRDSGGNVLFSGHKYQAGAASVIEAEARAVLFAVEMLKEKDITQIINEIYLLILFRAWWEHSAERW